MFTTGAVVGFIGVAVSRQGPLSTRSSKGFQCRSGTVHLDGHIEV
jgi:hypothetical protein